MRYFAALLFLGLAGCGSLFGDTSRDEVAWAKSPDSQVHAILLETNGGATTSFGYVVELHSADHQGEKPVDAGNLYGAVRSDCAYGVDLDWIDAEMLELRFESAKKIDVPPFVNVGKRRIRIIARSGVRNETAPCGGMEANNPLANVR